MPDHTITQAYADENSVSSVAGSGYIDTSNGTAGNAVSVPNYFDGPNAALGGEVFDGNAILTFYNVSDGQNFDNFFSGLVYGSHGVPIHELLGEANGLRLISAVEHLWRIIYAQVFRTSTDYLSADPKDIKAWTPQQPLNATFVNPNSFRLKQSEVATRILQALLAVLSLCGILAFCFIGTGRLLPKNPSSIAVVAGLLVGSEMLDIARAHTEKEGLTKLDQGRWDGYFFSLGWWERPGDTNTRRFGIDVGKAEKAS